MIKRLLAIAAVAFTGLLAAPKAEAGHGYPAGAYRSGYSSCGCPIYTQRYVRGYDYYRRPIFGYTRLALRHGSSCRHRVAHPPVYRRSACQTPLYRSSHPVYGARVVISGRSYPYRSSGYTIRGRSFGFPRGSGCR